MSEPFPIGFFDDFIFYVVSVLSSETSGTMLEISVYTFTCYPLDLVFVSISINKVNQSINQSQLSLHVLTDKTMSFSV